MSGYSAIGKKPAAIAPRSMMMIEITQARTGRSIKKRANMGVNGQWSVVSWQLAVVSCQLSVGKVIARVLPARQFVKPPAPHFVVLLPASPQASARLLFP